MEDLQNIHPLKLAENEEGKFVLYFDADLQYERFEDLEREHNGFIWIDLIDYFIEINLPDLLGQFQYEPDHDQCAIIGEFEEIKQLTLALHSILYNDAMLSELIEAI